MKKLIILFVVLLASHAYGAQLVIDTVGTYDTPQKMMQAADDNFDELYGKWTALGTTHDTSGELDALYEGELNNIAGLAAALSDDGAWMATVLGWANAGAARTSLGLDSAANLETNLSLGAYASDLLGMAAATALPIGDTAFTDLTAGDTYTNFGDADDDTIDELFDAIDTAIGGLGGGHDAVTIASGITGLTLSTQELSLNAYIEDLAEETWASQDIVYYNGSALVGLTKGANGTILGINGSGNLAYLTNFSISDSDYQFYDSADTTKQAQFELGSITTSTKRTYTLPDASGTFLMSDGDGSSLTSVDAATGDSATAFFDAGTIEHERGGLEADVSAYAGLVAISGGSTSNVTDAAGLETALSLGAFASNLLGTTSEANFKSTVNLEIGTDVQAYDADLTTWAGVTPGTNVGTALAVAVGGAGSFTVNGDGNVNRLFLSDACSGVGSPATGDICFEY